MQFAKLKMPMLYERSAGAGNGRLGDFCKRAIPDVLQRRSPASRCGALAGDLVAEENRYQQQAADGGGSRPARQARNAA
jgi:hypothetical protein